jgi:hypothetical protein
VAVRVVDRLELVEVGCDHAHGGAALRGLRAQFLQAPVQREAVEQAGERSAAADTEAVAQPSTSDRRGGVAR